MTLKFIERMFEGLVQAIACYDSIEPGEEPGIDKELLEAAASDIKRACNAVEQILVRNNALPSWAVRTKERNKGDDVEIPF